VIFTGKKISLFISFFLNFWTILKKKKKKSLNHYPSPRINCKSMHGFPKIHGYQHGYPWFLGISLQLSMFLWISIWISDFYGFHALTCYGFSIQGIRQALLKKETFFVFVWRRFSYIVQYCDDKRNFRSDCVFTCHLFSGRNTVNFGVFQALLIKIFVRVGQQSHPHVLVSSVYLTLSMSTPTFLVNNRSATS